MFKAYIWLKTFKYELIAAVVNIILAVFAGIYRDNATILTTSLVVIVISLFVVVYIRSKDKDFYFLPLNKAGQENDWIGRGDWKYKRTDKCFEITNSHVGFLFPKTLLWDDYSIEFDFKIVSHSCAWIVRAQNLSNYVMMQCTQDGINPHIRLDGQWVVYRHSDVQLSFQDTLDLDKWHKAKIVCDKRNISISLSLDSVDLFNRHWAIPEKLVWEVEKQNNKGKLNLIRDIDFDFGGIGFRANGNEKGFIKNVYIEKI